MNTGLLTYLNSWIRWSRIRRALVWSFRGLAAGLGLAWILLLFLVLNGRMLAADFVRLLVGLPALMTVIAAATGGLRPVGRLAAARDFDRIFGLDERVSTALELQADDQARRYIPRRLLGQQYDDAVLAARAVRAPRQLPLPLPRRELLLALIFLAASALLWVRGERFFALAEQRRAVEQAIAAEQEELIELIEAIQANPDLTPEQQDALIEPLQEAEQGLSGAGNLEDAVSVLQTTEQRLEELSDQQSLQQSQDLRDAGRRLSQDTGTPLENFGQELAEGDLVSAGNELENLDVDSLSESERQELADQLEAAAEQVQNNNPELAEQLRSAAEAARSGDAAAAEQALSEAAQSLTETAQQAAQAEAAQQAAGEVGQGEQRLVQTGQIGEQVVTGGSPGEGQQGQGQQGEGSEGGQGSQGGQQGGSSTTPGQEPGGTGAGQGTSEGSPQVGPPAGEGPIAQDNAPGDGGERGYERIFVPERVGGEGGEQVTLPGSDEPGETVVGQGSPDPGAPGSGSVPYVEVFPAYDQAAREAIESGVVPPALRSLVRDYFSSLEP